MRIHVTFNLAAIAAGVTMIAGTILVLVAADLSHDLGVWCAWVGFIFTAWGSVAFIEFRLEHWGRRLQQREIDAYEAGRLRGL